MLVVFSFLLPSAVLRPSQAGGPFTGLDEAQGVVQRATALLPQPSEMPEAPPDSRHASLPLRSEPPETTPNSQQASLPLPPGPPEAVPDSRQASLPLPPEPPEAAPDSWQVSLPLRPEPRAQPKQLPLPRGAPLADFEITGEFGPRRHPLTRRQVHHGGIDLRAPLRSPVRVTGPGTVTFAGTAGTYGKMIEVDHGNGVVTRYGHLAIILVKKDQVLQQGQLIGRSGATGRVTGPHLHYELLVDGVPRDPTDLIEAAFAQQQRRQATPQAAPQVSGQTAAAKAISPQPSRTATKSIEETP